MGDTEPKLYQLDAIKPNKTDNDYLSEPVKMLFADLVGILWEQTRQDLVPGLIETEHGQVNTAFWVMVVKGLKIG